MNRAIKVALGVVVVLLIAGGSFYGGTLYGKAQAQAVLPARAQFRGTPGAQGAFVVGQGGTSAGGMLAGEIQSISDDLLTVKDLNGNEVQVRVTDTTLIQKQASVTVADLEQGETIMVSGSRGADGSLTARSIQVVSGAEFMGGPAFQREGTFPGAATPNP